MIRRNGVVTIQGTKSWDTHGAQGPVLTRFKCEDADTKLRLPRIKVPCHKDPELFFATSKKSTDRAIQLCQTCPLKNECLERTLALEKTLPLQYRHGISGALTPQERFQLQAEREAQ